MPSKSAAGRSSAILHHGEPGRGVAGDHRGGTPRPVRLDRLDRAGAEEGAGRGHDHAPRLGHQAGAPPVPLRPRHEERHRRRLDRVDQGVDRGATGHPRRARLGGGRRREADPLPTGRSPAVIAGGGGDDQPGCDQGEHEAGRGTTDEPGAGSGAGDSHPPEGSPSARRPHHPTRRDGARGGHRARSNPGAGHRRDHRPSRRPNRVPMPPDPLRPRHEVTEGSPQ